MHASRTRFWATTLAALVVLLPLAEAVAQVTLPMENHYVVYLAQPPYGLQKPIGLRDQFGSYQVQDLTLNWFANPAEKRVTDPGGTVHVYPIINPDIHLNWWRLYIPSPQRTIRVTDQFGSGEWIVGDAIFLLTPALKNVGPGQLPPPWNHYLCYVAGGPQRNITVNLQDQFGNTTVFSMTPYVFCNPVEKTDDGLIYPIEDPTVHLAVYLHFRNPVSPRTITSVDQFGAWDRYVFETDFLCLPALKEEIPIRTEQSTWGRIKALYR